MARLTRVTVRTWQDVMALVHSPGDWLVTVSISNTESLLTEFYGPYANEAEAKEKAVALRNKHLDGGREAVREHGSI